MLARYQPSGKFSPIVFVFLLPLLVSVVGAAWLDALLLYWIPFIYVEAFIVIGFAAAVGWATAFMLKIAKCRNKPVGLMVGALAGLTAVAAGHYWTYSMTVASITRPVSFMEYVEARVATGWSLGHGGSGLPISGVFVYVVWLIEAAILMVGGVVGGIQGAMTPFCETCNIWATTKVAKFSVPGVSMENVVRLQTATDVETLLTPRLIEGVPLTPSDVGYVVERCVACEETAFVSLSHTLTTVDKRGKAEKKTTNLLTHVCVTPVEVDALRQLGGEMVGTPVAS